MSPKFPSYYSNSLPAVVISSWLYYLKRDLNDTWTEVVTAYCDRFCSRITIQVTERRLWFYVILNKHKGLTRIISLKKIVFSHDVLIHEIAGISIVFVRQSNCLCYNFTPPTYELLRLVQIMITTWLPFWIEMTLNLSPWPECLLLPRRHYRWLEYCLSNLKPPT